MTRRACRHATSGPWLANSATARRSWSGWGSSSASYTTVKAPRASRATLRARGLVRGSPGGAVTTAIQGASPTSSIASAVSRSSASITILMSSFAAG